MVPGTRRGQRAAGRQESTGHVNRHRACQESTGHVNRGTGNRHRAHPGTAPGGAAARARTAQSSSARQNARATPPPAPCKDASRAPPPTRRPSSLTAGRREPLGRAGGSETRPAGKNRALRPRPNLHRRVGNGRRTCAVPRAGLGRGLRPFLSPQGGAGGRGPQRHVRVPALRRKGRETAPPPV